jgi:hypothetical protein
MKPWLEDNLEGVDPRAEMALLRDAVLSGAHRGVDLAPFWRALAALDPVAAAELAAGPRAVVHRGAVEGALVVAEQLEGVLAPSGLYSRLLDLSEDAGPAILHTAASRHPTGQWLAVLCRRVESVPGAAVLAMYRSSPRLGEVCDALAAGGAVEGLVMLAASDGCLEPVVALYRAGQHDRMIRAAAAALDHRPTAPLVPWLAAVHGPLLDPLLQRIVVHLTNSVAIRSIRHASTDFAGTLAALDERSS